MSRTIGVMINHMGGAKLPYERSFARSVADVARDHDSRVIFYTGGFYNTPTQFEGRHNFIFDLISSDKPDGLIALSSLLGEFCPKEDLYSLLNSFSPIPIVSVGIDVPGIPSVLINNYEAMRSVMEHIFAEHDPQQVVYIGGPPNGYEAQERKRAFLDVMKENSRKTNPSLIFQGRYIRASGCKVALELLANRMPFDTVVCASDETALGFMSCAAENGLIVPRDYRITGFDDLDQATLYDPPLTTVRQDIYSAGAQATSILHDMIAGRKPVMTTRIPTPLVVRDSCGCTGGAIPDLNEIKSLKETILSLKRDSAIRDQEEYDLTNISEGLINTNTEAELCAILDSKLPALREIKRCTLCRYKQTDTGPRLQPFLKYIQEEGAYLCSNEPWQETSSSGTEDSSVLRVMESLNFGTKILGVIIFECTTIPYTAFGFLRKQLSQTLQHIHTFSRIAELNTNLATEVEHLSSLRIIDQAITGVHDRTMLLNVLMSEILTQQKADGIIISLIDPAGSTPIVAASRGVRNLFPDDERPIAVTPLFVPDLTTKTGDDIDNERQILFAEEDYTGYCRVPLSVHGEVNGILELFTRRPLPEGSGWRHFLETLAGQAAIAIENDRLVHGLKRANTCLRESYNTTIEGWSRALDLRDHETEGHCIRVAQMSVRLGRKLGLDEHDIENLYRGALLHDIGKVGIPDSILLKPGPLTHEERTIMNKHPKYAHDLLAPIEFLLPALSVPWCHHEKWDGTGYPQGLKGKDIPLFARIFAVIDVWDALSSERPYRGPWEREKVVAYLRAESGTHFDPDVVNAFLEFLPE
jgi:HD-GYP domain-containing protein (c-di-GMP phosphodiesterase class II)/DNA-binding LacI/PurR family transcriptional regulator